MSDPQLLTILVIVAFGPMVLVSIHYYQRRNASKVGFVASSAWAVLFLMIALPSAKPARSTAQRNSCIANLKQLAEAKRSWATLTKPDTSTTAQTADLAPYLKQGQIPSCPAEGTYSLGAVNELPRCSLHALGHSLEPIR